MASRWRIWLLLGVAAVCFHAVAQAPVRRYEIVTETGMPHLEENLRYTVQRETRCLRDDDLPPAFPILSHPSLAGCALEHPKREVDTTSYRLVCKSARGTTGSATWRHAGDISYGTLDVKLGGKNMTFFQRITAKNLGDCHG